MKKLFTIGIGLLIGCTIYSCEKDDNNNTSNNNNTTNPPATFFDAKVDQNNFPTANIKFTMAKYVSSTKMLQIIGQPEDQKETIVITLMCTNGKVQSVTDWNVGNYAFQNKTKEGINFNAVGEYNKWNGSGYEQWFSDGANNQGELRIDKNDGQNIIGTFSFNAAFKNTDGSFNTNNLKHISEGTFNLEIKTL